MAVVAVAALTAGFAPASPAGAVTVDCQVDPSSTIPAAYPNARTYANIIGNGGCEIVWDYVVERLVDGRYTPPASFAIHWVGEGPPGYVTSGGVYLNYHYIQDIWNQYGYHDWGLAYHEFAHVAQSYPAGANSQWVTEGLADWVRYDQGQPPPGHGPDPSCNSRHYTQGYECAAAFLGWIDENYRQHDPHSFITLLNGAYHFGSENSPAENLQILTGETIDQLWWECLYEDCAGGYIGPP